MRRNGCEPGGRARRPGGNTTGAVRRAAVFAGAGQTARFTATGVDGVKATDAGAAAWVRGILIADDLPLCEFLAELGRYRATRINCDPAISGLRISGAFPLTDISRVLVSLAGSLPVVIDKQTDGGVIVRPR